MESQDGQMAITIEPETIKNAQEAIGRLDVHVCGDCHAVFHFVEEFVKHRTKEDACSKTSHFRDSNNQNEQKAQVWAFLLWKDSQVPQEGANRDAANSWELYQQWCTMETHIRETWVSAGKAIQAFTKLSNAKMSDSPRSTTAVQTPTTPTNEAKQQTTMIRKVMRNGQPEDTEIKKENKSDVSNQKNDDKEVTKKPVQHVRPRCVVIPKFKPGTLPANNETENTVEYPVEKIMAKRFNTKKKCVEFLLKWEGYPQEQNTWETQEVVDTCKYLIEEFERNLAKQKEMKALREKQLQQQQQSGKKVIRQVVQTTPVIKQEVNRPGPSTSVSQQQGPGRPPRSSKTKAMDQVKVWCGSMKDEENDLLGKRHVEYTDSDSEDTIVAKRMKAETHSDEEWTGESEEEKTGRNDTIQRAFKAATNGSNNKIIIGSSGTAGTIPSTTTIVTTADLTNLINVQAIETSKSGGTIIQQPQVVTMANQKAVKVDGNKLPQLTSGVYMMHRKEGIIKLESSPSGKMNVKSPQNSGVLMVQNRDGTAVMRKQVIGTSTANSITPVKVVSKSDGTQVVTPMKYIAKTGTPRTHQITQQQSQQQQQQQQQQQRIITQQKNEPIKIQPKPELGQVQQVQQVQQLQIVTAVPTPVQIQSRVATTPTIRQTSPQIQQRTPDGRQIVQRQNIRGQQTPTSVLGNTRATTATSVRTPLTKQQTTPIIQGQPRQQIVQKRIITTPSSTPQLVKESMSPNQVVQARPKFTIVSSSAAQVAKSQQSPTSLQTINKQAQKLTPKTTIQQTQSLLSPQQKLLMAKKKAQAEANNANKMSPKTTVTSIKTTTTAAAAVAAASTTPRGRGRPSLSSSTVGLSTASATTIATSALSQVVVKPKETKVVGSDGIVMEFHAVSGGDNENNGGDGSTQATGVNIQLSIPETNCQISVRPESPQPQYTLCPLTGRIIGPDGEPKDTSDASTTVSQESTATATTTDTTKISQVNDSATTTTTTTTTTTITTDSKPSSLSLPTIDTTPSMPLIQTDATPTSSVQAIITTPTSSSTAHIVLPSLDGSGDGGVIRVEMSPGGTTGTLVQSANDATTVTTQQSEPEPMDVSVEQGLPSLDDTTTIVSSKTTTASVIPSVTTSNITITTATTPVVTGAAATTTTTNNDATATLPITSTTVATTTSNKNDSVNDTQKTNNDDNTLAVSAASVGVVDDASNLVTITGEDGVVYQVAGQAADGQTLLVTRGADGEQQCVYVTTEQQGADGSVLTLDHAVAEAVAQLMPDGQVGLAPQFYVKEGDDGSNSEQVVMSIMDTSGAPGQEDPDSQAQVVAQVVQADEPTPGGTRRVVLLLPDGNLMMTEVDEEQYAALELDK